MAARLCFVGRPFGRGFAGPGFLALGLNFREFSAGVGAMSLVSQGFKIKTNADGFTFHPAFHFAGKNDWAAPCKV